jgi:hypothetical protein
MSPLAMAARAALARVVVSGAGSPIVNGLYTRREATIVPAAFSRVCHSSGWDAAATWSRLNGPRHWWESDNASYIYFNSGDRLWWLDSGESGLGLYVSSAVGAGSAPPSEGWRPLGDSVLPLPTLSFGEEEEEL